jgi:uncharacterized membrane protein YidH (DUF202 family)
MTAPKETRSEASVRDHLANERSFLAAYALLAGS